jgi:hypothetical protein
MFLLVERKIDHVKRLCIIPQPHRFAKLAQPSVDLM